MNDIEYFGFIWDRDKAESNRLKHKVSFETAVYIFQDPYLYEIYDINHSDEEERFAYIGSVMGELILFVVTTDRNGKTRVISARKATKTERNKYYENIKKLQKYESSFIE